MKMTCVYNYIQSNYNKNTKWKITEIHYCANTLVFPVFANCLGYYKENKRNDSFNAWIKSKILQKIISSRFWLEQGFS